MHSGSLLWLLQVKYTHQMTDGWMDRHRLMILQVQRLPLRFRPSLSSSLLVYIQEVQNHSGTTSTGRRRRGEELNSFLSSEQNVGNDLRV